MSDIATFDGAPPPGTINLAVGQPSSDLLPVDLLRHASNAFLNDAQNIELNYGVLQGDERFLQSLAHFLSEGYHAEISAESLLVTAGNSQALDLVSTIFARSGDTVFVEEPSYFLAFQIFRDHGLNIVGIPVDDDGLDIECLRKELENHRPAFVYTIPSFHNPGGQTLCLARREQLLELSKQHRFLVVADEVYHLLSYGDEPPAAFGTLISSETVLSLGSFSKILAPALRLGWIQTSPTLMNKILAGGFINSGGSMNHYTSHIVRLALDLGLQATHLEHLRNEYRARVGAMDDALNLHFKGVAEWSRPSGGYFFWLRFDEKIVTASFREEARDRETGFQSGSVFSTRDGLKNCMRLSFSHYNESDIHEGVRRLRPLFD